VEPGPHLFLTVEALPGPATLARLQAALSARPVASVLLIASPGGGGAIDVGAAARLAGVIQSHGAAALIEDSAELARTVGADGVHLSAVAGPEEAYVAARAALGRDKIVGAAITGSRHDAMSLAEMGADYIAFAGPERDEFVAWWAGVFVVPCVALGIETPEDADRLAAAGADFLGLALPPAGPIADAEAHIRTITNGLVRGNVRTGSG